MGFRSLNALKLRFFRLSPFVRWSFKISLGFGVSTQRFTCVRCSFQAILKLKDLERFCLAVLGDGKILKSDVRYFIVFDFVWFYLIEISGLQRDSDSLRAFYATLSIKFRTFALKDLEIYTFVDVLCLATISSRCPCLSKFTFPCLFLQNK